MHCLFLYSESVIHGLLLAKEIISLNRIHNSINTGFDLCDKFLLCELLKKDLF